MLRAAYKNKAPVCKETVIDECGTMVDGNGGDVK